MEGQLTASYYNMQVAVPTAYCTSVTVAKEINTIKISNSSTFEESCIHRKSLVGRVVRRLESFYQREIRCAVALVWPAVCAVLAGHD